MIYQHLDDNVKSCYRSVFHESWSLETIPKAFSPEALTRKWGLYYGMALSTMIGQELSELVVAAGLPAMYIGH